MERIAFQQKTGGCPSRSWRILQSVSKLWAGMCRAIFLLGELESHVSFFSICVVCCCFPWHCYFFHNVTMVRPRKPRIMLQELQKYHPQNTQLIKVTSTRIFLMVLIHLTKLQSFTLPVLLIFFAFLPFVSFCCARWLLLSESACSSCQLFLLKRNRKDPRK